MAIGKISTDTTHRAVPRRQLSFLLLFQKNCSDFGLTAFSLWPATLLSEEMRPEVAPFRPRTAADGERRPNPRRSEPLPTLSSPGDIPSALDAETSSDSTVEVRSESRGTRPTTSRRSVPPVRRR